MAVLNAKQLAKLRQGFQREGNHGAWVKADLNAAFQAIEDWFESNRGGLNGAITAATAPGLLSADVMKKLGKHWLRHKHEQGG